MLVNLTKDEMKVVVYYLKGKELMPEGNTIKSIHKVWNKKLSIKRLLEN